MIIRSGMNVRYSHDEEALIAALMEMREFAGVPQETLATWIHGLSTYCYSADYYARYDEEDGEWYGFAPANQYLYVSDELRPQIKVVTLWKPEETARRLLEDHGFSCITCGVHADWQDKPAHGWETLAVNHRSSRGVPVLTCPACTSFIRMVFADPYEPGVDRAVKGIIQHFREIAA